MALEGLNGDILDHPDSPRFNTVNNFLSLVFVICISFEKLYKNTMHSFSALAKRL
jgi:hypothetical protein